MNNETKKMLPGIIDGLTKASNTLWGDCSKTEHCVLKMTNGVASVTIHDSDLYGTQYGRLRFGMNWPRDARVGWIQARDVAECLPGGKKESLPNDEITLANTKTPEAIGAEVWKRLVKPNLPILDRIKARIAERLKHLDGQEETVNRMCVAFNGRPSKHTRGEVWSKGVTKIHVLTRDSVQLEVYTTPEGAEHIAEILREFPEKD